MHKHFLKLLFIFTIITSSCVSAQDDYSIRIAYGQASTKDFGEIVMLTPDIHPDDLSVVSLDAGYLLEENFFELPIDLYAKAGLSYFKEADLHISGTGPAAVIYSGERSDAIEGTIYVKAYYNFDFLKNRVRLGFGEGLSYTSSALWSEEKEATQENEKYSKFLNYLDVSLDVDIGKLFNYKALENTYLAWTIKHRSGIFGLFNGVDGGSNYNTISIETNF
ncbi:hypothetical protein [Sulfurimonas sp.]